MSERRVMRNRARVGKPWLVVEGLYKGSYLSDRRRWVTITQLSEHETKDAAETALRQWNQNRCAL